MKIGFIVWNEFQITVFKKLTTIFDDVTIIIEKRPANNDMFELGFLKSIKCNFIFVDKNKIKNLDGFFDVIFCQTIFSQIEHIKKSKIAMLQYGLAKENHNYGSWRSFADVIFCYGKYSQEKLNFFAPSYSLGHPSFNLISIEEIKKTKENLSLDKKKKTILYCPTWGDLSSYRSFISSIQLLSNTYNVILKLHHNTIYLHQDSIKKNEDNVFLCTNENIDKLIQISDVVISDYSGAIFDAIYSKKNVILLQETNFEHGNHPKVSPDSLEISRGNEIGIIVKKPTDLNLAIQKSLHTPFHNNKLKSELFTNELGHDWYDIKKILLDVVNGKIKKHQGQRFINELTINERIKTFRIKKMESGV